MRKKKNRDSKLNTGWSTAGSIAYTPFSQNIEITSNLTMNKCQSLPPLQWKSANVNANTQHQAADNQHTYSVDSQLQRTTETRPRKESESEKTVCKDDCPLETGNTKPETMVGLRQRKTNVNQTLAQQPAAVINNKTKRRIWIKYKIFNVLWIDTVAQSFRVRFSLEATWEDPTINGIEPSKVVIEDVWKPRRVKFVNVLESEFTPTFEVCTWEKNPGPNAVMTCYFNCAASFITKMDLRMFPFDFQDLRLTFTMLSREQDIEFEINPFRESGMDYVNHMLPEWEPLFTHHSFQYQEENNLPVFHIQCKLQRRAGYYITNVALPVFLITTLTWLGYAIPVADTGSRMEAILTLVLTSIAFKIVLAGHLPPLSYNTLCDYYVLFSLLFQVAVAVQIGATPMILRALGTELQQEKAEMVDKVFGTLMFISYLAMHLMFMIKIRRHTNRNRTMSESKDSTRLAGRRFSV